MTCMIINVELYVIPLEPSYAGHRHLDKQRGMQCTALVNSDDTILREAMYPRLWNTEYLK